MDFYTTFEGSSSAEFFYDKILTPQRRGTAARRDGWRS
jgi:hypothetical protein